MICKINATITQRKNDHFHYHGNCETICNSNWTEWSTIQGKMVQVISKSNEGEAQGQFEIMSMIYPRIVQHEVQLLINHIYNKFRN